MILARIYGNPSENATETAKVVLNRLDFSVVKCPISYPLWATRSNPKTYHNTSPNFHRLPALLQKHPFPLMLTFPHFLSIPMTR